MDTTSTPSDQRARRRRIHVLVSAWVLLLGCGFISITFSFYCAKTYHLEPLPTGIIGAAPILLALIGSHLTASYNGDTWIKVLAIGATVAAVGLSTDGTIQVLWHAMGIRAIFFGLVPDVWDVIALNAILVPEHAWIRGGTLQGDVQGDPEITLDGDPESHPDGDPDLDPDGHPEITLQSDPGDGGQGDSGDGRGEGPDPRRADVGMIAVERLRRTGTRNADDAQIAEAVGELLDTYGPTLTSYRIVNALRGRKGSVGEDRAGRVLKQVLTDRQQARTG